jgi:hypothetical protein
MASAYQREKIFYLYRMQEKFYQLLMCQGLKFNVLSHEGNANQNNTEIHLTPARMAIIKKIINKSCGKDVGTGIRMYKSLYTVCKNVN